MFCRYCGDDLAGSEVFCGSCGKATSDAPPPQPTPRLPTAASPTPAPAASARPAALPQVVAGTVKTHLGMAILSTLLCCLPLGILSIVHAARVNGRLAAGDVQGALESSRKARFWWVLAFVLGALLNAYLVIQVLAQLESGGY